MEVREKEFGDWIKSKQVDYPHSDLTGTIINAVLEVHKTLGPGFLEHVYHEALMYEFDARGLKYDHEKLIKIKYKDVFLKKEYSADFLVEDIVVVEVKATKQLINLDEMQIIHYLKATEKPVGLLFNFGARNLEIKRRAN